MTTPAPPRRLASFLNRRSSPGEETRSADDRRPRAPSETRDSRAAERTRSFDVVDPFGDDERRSKEQVARLLKKARKYHKKLFRYRHAMKCYLLVLKRLNDAGVPDSDPFATKVLQCLNDVHHAQSTLVNSASIVEMGIHHEDKNQLVKALKMYTVAYRMRRDVLGADHPSLPVLLNMMGSVQIKRGDYAEAMKIYDLSLRGRGDENGGKGRKKDAFRKDNPLTTSVTLRDMGMILEWNGSEEKALRFYHASLRYAVKFKKGLERRRGVENEGVGGTVDGFGDDDSEEPSEMTSDRESIGDKESSSDAWLDMDNYLDAPFSLEEVRMVKSTKIGKNGTLSKESSTDSGVALASGGEESGEMELFLEKRFDHWAFSQDLSKCDSTNFYYDELYVSPSPTSTGVLPAMEEKSQQELKWEGADVDIAMTLHQIGQIHRRSHRYAAALSAYNASLRGMKQVLGTQHANIAAILGNIGNLYMEMGDHDEAFAIYQEVLGIETLHLGLSHPEVAVTLHNIATIECSRGNFAEGVSLYKQVVDMQKIRYGHEHITVAITLSCLADAYEKLGNVNGAIKTYEEALKIRKGVLGTTHIDVGRLMHKLGRLASSREDFRVADVYIKRASEIYALNELKADHLFFAGGGKRQCRYSGRTRFCREGRVLKLSLFSGKNSTMTQPRLMRD